MFCTIRQHKQLLSGFSDDSFQFIHRLISDFDAAVERAGMLKYQFVGEWYIVTCPRADSALDLEEQSKEYPATYTVRMIELAQTLQSIAARQVTRYEEPLVLQVGLSAGPIAAAVVGGPDPTLCLYGTAVNTAARLAKHAASSPQACAAVAEDIARADGGARCVAVGIALLKGLGNIEIFEVFVDSKLLPATAQHWTGTNSLAQSLSYSARMTRAAIGCLSGCLPRSMTLLVSTLAAALALFTSSSKIWDYATGVAVVVNVMMPYLLYCICCRPLISKEAPRPSSLVPPGPRPSELTSTVGPLCTRRRAVVVQLDLCGFTALAKEMGDPRELAELVQGLFAAFDAAVAAAGLARVETIGDAYIAARYLGVCCGPGADGADTEEAQACAAALQAARAMLEAVRACRRDTGPAVACRIGVSVGDVVVAVLGTLKVS